MGSASSATGGDVGAVAGASSRPRTTNARSMTVSDVMSTGIHTCSMQDMLDRPARIMAEHECGAVPVVDAAGHAIAIVTDRDICMAALACQKLLSQIPVMTAASRRMHVVRTVDTLDCAHELMCKHHVRRLPVTDDGGHLIGIVSIVDLVRAARSCGQPGLGDA